MKKEYVVLVKSDNGRLGIAISIIDDVQSARVLTQVDAVKLRDKLGARFNDADYVVCKLVEVSEGMFEGRPTDGRLFDDDGVFPRDSE